MTADVAVIGGGLSGLAAAVDSARRGLSVALCEQAPRLGGRCYSYVDKTTGDIVDNGQHVLLGAYKSTLKYLELTGTRFLLKEEPSLRLPLHHPRKGFAAFEVSALPKPFHLTAGMLKFKLLTLGDRRRLLNVGLQLHRWGSAVEKKLSSLTVSEWLEGSNQSPEARKCLWYPIAISVMNELPQRASALLFARSLRSAFLGSKSDSAVLLPIVGQTELYVQGAERYLARKGARVLKNTEVTAVGVESQDRLTLDLKSGGRIRARSVISAVPHFALQKMLPRGTRKTEPFASLPQFTDSPIVSVHLWFDREFMDADYVGLIGGGLQWVFNRRRIMNQTDRQGSFLSAVVSAAHLRIRWPREKLVFAAVEELRHTFSDFGKSRLLHSVVIKERRATFSATNAAEALRPSSRSPLRNFYLAGDWTDTGLPATIEGAIRSGFAAAEAVACDHPGS